MKQLATDIGSVFVMAGFVSMMSFWMMILAA